MNFSIEIANAKHFIKRGMIRANHHADVLDKPYFNKIETNIIGLINAKAVFELNAEYEKPSPNRVSCLLKHQAC